MIPISSILQIANGIGKLFFRSFRVPSGRVQILVAKNLSQPNQIVSIVLQIFVSHRVSAKMGMNFYADDRSVLVAQCSNTTVAQRSSFTDENLLTFNRRSGF
jgi:hypothetical protein